jgi:hypothetical protein
MHHGAFHAVENLIKYTLAGQNGWDWHVSARRF